MSTRIRCVKPDFFRHSGLFRLEQETKLPIRLGFEGLWIVADREGRFRWKPEELKLDVLPYDDVDFAVLMAELERHRFVVQYRVEGELYGFIPTWSRHQRPNHKESSSRLPAPPDSVSRDAQLQLEMSAKSDASVPVVTASSRGEHAVSTACSRVGQVGKSCPGEEKSNSGGKGTGKGTGKGRGINPPLPPFEVLPAPAAEKAKPRDDQKTLSSTTVENGDDNVVPLDLTELEYARGLLDDLGMPQKGNIVVVADSIRAFARSREPPTLQAAFEQMRAIALDARARGEPVDHLWFLNGRYHNPKRRSRSDVATDEYRERSEDEYARLDRNRSRAARS